MHTQYILFLILIKDSRIFSFTFTFSSKNLTFTSKIYTYGLQYNKNIKLFSEEKYNCYPTLLGICDIYIDFSELPPELISSQSFSFLFFIYSLGFFIIAS